MSETTLEERRERFEKAQARCATYSSQRERLLGELDAKKRELAELGREIRGQGIDPKNLKAYKASLEEEYDTLMTSLEADLDEVESAFKQYSEQKTRGK